ncbi:hypothetical protein DXG03_007317 [Asterophora parasitica]|uniref:Mannoprotein n=1 Tax=Asterophora parasitica TaxID=117018 RepID=A0A9P7FZ68_9AGAR|nr:hypothetical protein DXG03_007317 [Asterophora parasitica]
MFHSTSSVLGISLFATLASAQLVPLVDKHFAYPDGIPYQADTDIGVRGGQAGYNRCNATTEGQNSLCQTSFLNSLSDFCLWAPINPNSTVGDVEGQMVAWCSQPGHGARTIPAGTLTGLQFTKTPDYVQIVGFLTQNNVNLQPDDFGGEMDPHGADLRGNPLGGLMYSNAFGTNKNAYTQVIEWHNFIGSNAFCLKVCDPAGPNAAQYCQHIYDRIGCAYNAPNNAQNNVFESCLGDNQDFPGVYVENGVTKTYTQPPESLGPISTIPYVARVPASSSCTPFQSSALFAAAATVLPPATTSASATASITASGASSKPTSRAGTSAAASASAPKPTQTGNDASTLAISSAASILGVVFAGLFLA